MTSVRKVWGASACGLALAAVFAASPISASAQDDAAADVTPLAGMSESVAATVNDGIISTYDLAQRMRLLIVTSGVQPTQQNLPQIQREALISLVDERLQIQELRRVEKEQKFEIVATDKDVDEEIEQMARGNNMSPDQFIGALKAQGVYQSLRDQIRAQTSWQRWIRGRYGSRLRIGDDQITAALQHAEAAASKPQYEVSEVFIEAARVGGMDTAVQGAAQLISQMQQGAPFAAVARQFSASPTAASGGDAGWVTAGEFPPEVDNALEQMRPGQLSQPIPVTDGVYIIYLRDKRSGSTAQLVHLKQVAIAVPQDAPDSVVAAARQKLEALRPNLKGCDGLEATANKVQGVVSGDLGEAEVKDLAPAFRQAAETLQPGQLSEPIRTTAGLHLIAVCGKRAAGGEQLTRDEIENRLYGQQLSMLSRRYMRDLRNSATIETR
ncbi:peptidylprolyl isomerase [Phenylobacterium sp.]|uniref:peptidylprolyl isomerase n=1 Tax=Phenylobacterium sp. TaxID=1871053 RepID=UPI0035B02C13